MYAKKTLGQHFIKCRWVISSLVRAAEITASDTIIEIGPGTGTLTRALAEVAGKVIAVEKDEALAQNLRENLIKDGTNNVEIITGDILTLVTKILTRTASFSPQYKVVANIPYYLTARLFRVFLTELRRPKLMVLTIQKEVAKRITAKPPKMNLLALSVQIFGRPEIIKTVPASCFSPKPKITSAVIKISDISDRFFVKNKMEPAEFFILLRAAFAHKRKVLSSALANLVKNRDVAKKILKEAGLKEMVRAEELTLEQWAKIYYQVKNQK